MKKLGLAALCFLLISGTVVVSTEAYPGYWETYLQKIAEKYGKTQNLRPRYSATTRRSANNTVRFSNVNARTALQKRLAERLGRSGSRTTITSTTNTKLNAKVQMRVRSLSPREVIRITDDPIEVFELAFSHEGSQRSSAYQAPILIDKLEFDLIDNGGLLTQYANLLLSVEENDFWFNSDGTVTIKFGNLRLAAGAEAVIRVGIKIDDLDNVPRVPGSLRLRLQGGTYRAETGTQTANLAISGARTSELIAFNPLPESTGSAQVSGANNIQIYGQMLTAGQSAYVLSTAFAANYDDLYIDELTLTEAVSNKGVDVFVQSIEAIDTATGKTLAQTRFVNGRAKFRFSQRIFVPRGNQRKLAFRVTIADRVRSSNYDTQFRLTLAEADVKVQSASSGRYLTSANKNFRIDNETFTVVDGGIKLVLPTQQTRSLLVTGNLALQYDFQVIGQGRTGVDLARLTFRLSTNNLGFSGGISTNDFELVRLDPNGRVLGTIATTVTLNGSEVQIDFDRPLSIYGSDIAYLGLQAALENATTQKDYDGLQLQLLGDSSAQVGNLATVQATGANFIWSDRSAPGHGVSTQDWSKGYLIPGITNASVVLKRSW